MKLLFRPSLPGLTVQVLLWTILPFTILLVIFSLTGISQHERSMHALAANETGLLVRALAANVSLAVENVALHLETTPADVRVGDLNPQHLFTLDRPGLRIFLIDQQSRVLYRQGPNDTAEFPDHQIVPGTFDVFFNDAGDIIAHAPVAHTEWTVVMGEDWHSLTVPPIQLQEAMPFILFIAIVVSLLALYSGLRFVVRPLRLLRLQAGRIGTGDFLAAAHGVGGVREIEELRETLDQTAQSLQSSQKALEDYLGVMTQAQEDERARLARELHDETIQTLIALDHKAQRVQRALENQPELVRSRVGDLRQMTAHAIDEVRRFSRALRPSYLEELGLVPALEMLAKEASAEFDLAGDAERLKSEQEVSLFRITQEALSNARRHAQADQITVSLRFGSDSVVLSIYDNGLGFATPRNYTTLTRQGHYGLMGMHERAQLAGGSLLVESQPGEGTRVVVTIPR
jgi:signal transduction histidine kinase